MKLIRTGFSVLVLLVTSLCACGQDLTFSQFYEKPLLRNPALAGVFTGDLRISGAFRNQWASITIPYQTSALSAEVKFPVNNWNDWLTVGLQATHDVAGDIKLKRTQVLPVLNYHKSLSGNADDYLSVAFMAGPVNSQFDPTKVQMDDQFVNGSYDPNTPTQQVFERTGFNYWDASTGITYSSGFSENARFYLGVALFHFNKPKVAFYTSNSNVVLDKKYVVNAGVTVPTSEFNRVIVYADYFAQGGNRQFLGGIMYGTDIAQDYDEDAKALSLYFGGFLRWNDAFCPIVKMDMYDWSFGLSYDINLSKLRPASKFRGGIELTASFKTKFLNRSSTADKVRCIWF